MQELLHARYHNIHENKQKRYMIQTRSQAKTSGTVLTKVPDIDPNVQPKEQIIKPVVAPNHMFPLSQKISVILNED